MEAVGTKQCKQCKEEKCLTKFSKKKSNRDGLSIYCKPCRRERERIYNKNNPDKKRNKHLKYKYGITLEEYNSILDKQGGACKLCSLTDHTHGRGNVLYVDHCHTTGKVRGILCHNCNSGLGHFKDNIELLKKAIDYLKEEEYEI